MDTNPNWRNDRITKNYIKENAPMLEHPENMSALELATASTYCKTIYNPYCEEIMSRTGLLEKFRKAADEKGKRRILDKACAHYGIRLF